MRSAFSSIPVLTLFSFKKASAYLLCLSLLALSTQGLATHTLNQEKSALNFISIKNEHIAESHTFDRYSGTLSADGQLSISIDLSSVNTIIPIRNERMQKMLFDVANFSKATLSAKIDKEFLSLSQGETATGSVAGTLIIKDQAVPVSFEVSVVGLTNGGLRASTIKPTLLNTSSLGLDEGVAALQAIAKLNSISKTVPLSFDVVFEK
ncbi:YceI family protein [Glaciecola petra]|uniref:YceI family protein n=1 Tax=Glaciecola petra TaxID=3075602 RepID=A0ABU2ZS13_9ALTE|nr:YceI family protein [Aestuariibacter sp. P117]MDT0595191.1 YceI family protein [Aestuariibacter sp. P117]